MLRFARIALLLGSVVSIPAIALAQAPSGGDSRAGGTTTALTGNVSSPNASTVVIVPQGGGGSASGSDPGRAADEKGPKGPQNLAGYGYGTARSNPAPQAPAPRRVAAHRAGGPIATYPGFEMTTDGGSRLFVHLTQQVPVEEKRAAGSVTYVLRGAHVNVGNNHNALVTVHFNTPVTRARLVSVGNDLHFVVELRSAATPTFNVAAAQGGSGAVLSVQFPKGEFLSGHEDTDEAAAQKAPPTPEGAPAPKKPKKK
jgi:hypothetical protein